MSRTNAKRRKWRIVRQAFTASLKIGSSSIHRRNRLLEWSASSTVTTSIDSSASRSSKGRRESAVSSSTTDKNKLLRWTGYDCYAVMIWVQRRSLRFASHQRRMSFFIMWSVSVSLTFNILKNVFANKYQSVNYSILCYSQQSIHPSTTRPILTNTNKYTQQTNNSIQRHKKYLHKL